MILMKRTLPWAAAFSLVLTPMAYGQTMLSPSAEACLSCHRTAPDSNALPSLAGKSSAELATSLNEFRTGARLATIMNRIAKGYSEEESRALADEIAKYTSGAKP